MLTLFNRSKIKEVLAQSEYVADPLGVADLIEQAGCNFHIGAAIEKLVYAKAQTDILDAIYLLQRHVTLVTEKEKPPMIKSKDLNNTGIEIKP